MDPRFICGCRCHRGRSFTPTCDVCRPGHRLHEQHVRDYRLIKNHRAGA